MSSVVELAEQLYGIEREIAEIRPEPVDRERRQYLENERQELIRTAKEVGKWPEVEAIVNDRLKR